jgi:rSAM/selenodomain-associated transferase 1
MNDTHVLGIFAKAPLAGEAKTRLAGETSPAFAAELAEAMLLDTLARCRRVPVRRVLVFTPEASRAWFEEAAGPDYEMSLQGAGDLGARLGAFFAAQFRRGSRAVVVIGCDSPDVPVAWIREAFEKLDSTDVVIGPAGDGGYYLIGVNRLFPEIFQLDDWGGATVLQSTRQRVCEAQRSLALLPTWQDVDTLADVLLLSERLKEARRRGIDPVTPRTERTLAGWEAPSRHA